MMRREMFFDNFRLEEQMREIFSRLTKNYIA